MLEYRRDRETGMLTGLSDNYIRIQVKGPDVLQGKAVSVHIRDIAGHHTYGSVMNVID
jgi:hypothetical protein